MFFMRKLEYSVEEAVDMFPSAMSSLSIIAALHNCKMADSHSVIDSVVSREENVEPYQCF